MSDRDDLTDLHGDRIALANAIQDADIERAQLAAAIFDRIRDNVATKADLSLLHAELVGIRSATTGVQAEIALLAHKADVRGVSVEAARVREEVTALRGTVQALERHLNASRREVGDSCLPISRKRTKFLRAEQAAEPEPDDPEAAAAMRARRSPTCRSTTSSSGCATTAAADGQGGWSCSPALRVSAAARCGRSCCVRAEIALRLGQKAGPPVPRRRPPSV
jgi:hypothetical protein